MPNQYIDGIHLNRAGWRQTGENRLKCLCHWHRRLPTRVGSRWEVAPAFRKPAVRPAGPVEITTCVAVRKRPYPARRWTDNLAMPSSIALDLILKNANSTACLVCGGRIL